MKLLKIMLLLLPMGFVAVVVVGSGFLNYRFGSGFGASQFDRELFGALSAAIDGFKSMLPVIAGIAVAYGARRLWGASWAMWAICAVLSLVSSFGFVVQSRQDTAALKNAGAERRAELSEERKSIKGQTKRIKARPFSVVDADYQARCYTKKRKRWRSCKNLLRERGRAKAIKEGRVMTTAIDSAKAQISVTAGGDQQVKVISDMMAKTPFAVMVTIAIIFSIILEIVTGFGPAMLYAAFQYVLLGEKAAAMNFKLPRFLSRWIGEKNHTGGVVKGVPSEIDKKLDEAVSTVEEESREQVGFIRHLLKSADKHEDTDPDAVYGLRRLSSSVGVALRGEIKTFLGKNIRVTPGVLGGVDAYSAYQSWCEGRGERAVSFMGFHSVFSDIVSKNFPGVSITRDPRGRRFGDKIKYDGLALIEADAHNQIKQVI